MAHHDSLKVLRDQTNELKQQAQQIKKLERTVAELTRRINEYGRARSVALNPAKLIASRAKSKLEEDEFESPLSPLS